MIVSDKRVVHLEATKKALARIEVLDVLRGFSLLGILLVHAAHVFMSQQGAEPGRVPGAHEKGIKLAVDMLISGKFFSIFSLLFGLSFALQLQSSTAKGIPFVGRFTWRLALLMGIGCLHMLIFEFDILHIYAVVGLLLVLIHTWSNERLLLTSLLLLVCSIALASFITPISRAFAQALGPVASDFIINQLYTFRVFTVASLFVLGLYLGRKQIFTDNEENRILFNHLLVAAVCVFVAVKIGYYVLGQHPTWLHSYAGQFFENTYSSLRSLAISSIYVGLIVQLHKHARFRSVLDWLAPVGKMGLSIYVMQSWFLLAFFNLCAWWAGPEAIKIEWMISGALFFFGFQVLLANYWMKYFQMGPLEWAWRSMIYLKRQPIRRRFAY